MKWVDYERVKLKMVKKKMGGGETPGLWDVMI